MKFPIKWPSLDKRPEEVLGACVRYEDENFYSKNHELALDKVKTKFPDYVLEKEQARGWLTTRDRIVSEQEAQEIERLREQREGKATPLMRDPGSTLFKAKNE